MVNVGILVVSDTRGRGGKPDLCVPAISEFLENNGFKILKTGIVKDEIPEIQKVLKEWVHMGDLDLILTSGGTGVTPRDVTPEATHPLLTREIPGIPEAMRAASLQKTVMAVVSRSVAGLINETLVVNLPGSPKAAVENLEAVYKSFGHIVEKARGDDSDCAK